MLDTVDYVDRLPTVLRLCLRDWSAEGKEERNASYFHILNALSRWKEDVAERAKLTVLCPGAGLGRLPYEVRMFYRLEMRRVTLKTLHAR